MAIPHQTYVELFPFPIIHKDIKKIPTYKKYPLGSNEKLSLFIIFIISFYTFHNHMQLPLPNLPPRSPTTNHHSPNSTNDCHNIWPIVIKPGKTLPYLPACTLFLINPAVLSAHRINDCFAAIFFERPMPGSERTSLMIFLSL